MTHFAPRRVRLLTSTLFVITFVAGLSVSPADAAACPGGAAPTSLAFVEAPIFGTAGEELDPFQVKVKCSDGTSNDTTWQGSISLSLDQGATFASGSGSSQSAALGTANFGLPAVKINTAGDFVMTATAIPSGGVNLSSAVTNLTIIPGVRHHLAFTSQPPGTSDAGSDLSEVVVAIKDLFGNTLTSFPPYYDGDNTTQVTVALKTSPGGVASSFTNTGTDITTVTAMDGEASFSSLVIGKAGTYQITATSNASLVSDPTSSAFTIIAGEIGSKVGFTNGTIKVSERALSERFTLQQLDEGVNPVVVTGDPVTVKLSSSSLGGSFWKANGSGLLPGGCLTIPVGVSFAWFKYQDTIPGKPTLTASSMDLDSCGEEAISAGFDDATTATDSVNVQAAPPLVTISGAGFGTTGTVNWGSAEIIDVCSKVLTTNCIKKFADNGVQVVPPASDLGTSALVKVNSGNVMTTKDSTFYYGPVVTVLKPQTGAGGTAVMITGVGFGSFVQDSSVVNWGGASIDDLCSSIAGATKNCISKWSATSITVLAPDGTSGTSAVVKVNGGGAIQPAAFDVKFYYGPVITSLKPQGGPAVGGTLVTIGGAGFGTAFVEGVSTVKWGSSQITALCTKVLTTGCIKKFTDKSVAVVTPASTAGTVADVKVNGANVVSTVDNNFYYGAVVTSLKTQTGPITGGTQLTISGLGFGVFAQGTSTVNWGSSTITALCTSASDPTENCISKWSATSVTVLTPESTEAIAKVAVSVNAAPVTTAIDKYFYYGSVVTGLKPQ